MPKKKRIGITKPTILIAIIYAIYYINLYGTDDFKKVIHGWLLGVLFVMSLGSVFLNVIRNRLEKWLGRVI